MARAARDAYRQAARAGLLTALLSGCAQVQEPPGGPPDFTPPTLVSVRPDSGAVLPRFNDAAEFQFDEVVTEPTGQTASRLFLLSPRPRELDVDWKRTRLTVKPSGGWRQGVVYRLTLLPQVTDLRSNRLETGRVIVFSIGRPIPETSIAGRVVDWEAGRTARAALVEAVAVPDSTVYFTQTDSTGQFDLTAIPPGIYTLYGTIDGNNNQVRDRGEAFDSMTVALDSMLGQVFWAFRQDTLGPQIQAATRADSQTIAIEFTQALAPGPVDTAAIQVFALPDSSPVGVQTVWTQAQYDSVRAAERDRARAAVDSARADSAAADSVAAPRPPVQAPPAAAPDTTPAAQLVAQRPPLISRIFLRLTAPVRPGDRFLITSRLANVLGAVADSRSVLVIPGGGR